MKRIRKHQNLTSASDNAVFRSSVNKNEQDLPVRLKKEQHQRRLQLWAKALQLRCETQNVVSIVVAAEETTGSPSYEKRHIKECMGNFKLSPTCTEMHENRSFCSTYLCGDYLFCFWGVWWRFSRDLRHRRSFCLTRGDCDFFGNAQMFVITIY